jgi:adenylate cyclase
VAERLGAGGVTSEGDESSGARRRLAAALRRLESSPRALRVAKLGRELLPGDSRFGDPLSTAGREQPHVVGRRLAQVTEKRPGVLREFGLGALQVWQALSESSGRGRGDRELAIVFTDLVEFSDWALEAGDDAALELLRDVGEAIEPPVTANGGEVVKRLGDGMMAVFESPRNGLAAIDEARDRLARVEADGYEPRMRAGMHVGRPRRLGGDYLGIDVNVAARVTEEASADETIVSDRARELLGEEGIKFRRKRLFRVKGVPKDCTAYSVTAAR